MALHCERDSAIVQLVLALEKASVAAVKRETSVVLADVEELGGVMGSLIPVWLEGISLGSWVDVTGPGSSSLSGWVEGGGVGGAFGSRGEVIGAGSSMDAEEPPLAARKFCRPLRLGTRKL